MVLVVFANNRIVSVVDDDLDMAVFFYDALCPINGVQVFKFTDPVMALEHFKLYTKEYVIVISDLRMPVINGVQLLKTVKDLNPSARTILTTAYELDDNIFQEYTKKQIINGFLEKPIIVDELVKEVNAQLHYYDMQKIYPP